MSKTPVMIVLLALAMCWISASCTGPVFVRPAADASAAATPAAGSSATLAAAKAGPAAPAAVPTAAGASSNGTATVIPTTDQSVVSVSASASRWNGSAIFAIGAGAIFLVLLISMFAFRGKPS